MCEVGSRIGQSMLARPQARSVAKGLLSGGGHRHHRYRVPAGAGLFAQGMTQPGGDLGLWEACSDERGSACEVAGDLVQGSQRAGGKHGAGAQTRVDREPGVVRHGSLLSEVDVVGRARLARRNA
jgi:hypothetical protein